MTDREQYALCPANAAEFCRLWSAHMDTLEGHLSTDRWAVVAVTVALIAYPIARILIPTVLTGVVPDVVRTVLHLM